VKREKAAIKPSLSSFERCLYLSEQNKMRGFHHLNLQKSV